jgi:L-arabinose isomerase
MFPKPRPPEIWFVTGSQHLYGPEDAQAGRGQFAAKIVEALNASALPSSSSSSRC